MIPYAFELSEKTQQMVIIRLTTRVCHGRGNVVLGELPDKPHPMEQAEKLIIASGTGRLYCHEALKRLGVSDSVGLLSLATLWPLPKKYILS